MGKDPAFLFYPNDWIGGTMGMTFEEKGAYMELLMMQFNRGHMTTRMIGQTVGQLWDNIQDKFTQDENGLWYNERLEEEKIKRQTYVNSRHNNKSGKNQYSKKQDNKGGHMTSHMTGHMEDVNENKDKGGYGGKNVEDFVNTINTIFGKKYRVTGKIAPKIKNILKEYTVAEVERAALNAKKSDFHKDNGWTHLTPEFFTRSDKVDMWLNATNGTHKKQVEEPGANIPKLDKYANKL